MWVRSAETSTEAQSCQEEVHYLSFWVSLSSPFKIQLTVLDNSPPESTQLLFPLPQKRTKTSANPIYRENSFLLNVCIHEAAGPWNFLWTLLEDFLV